MNELKLKTRLSHTKSLWAEYKKERENVECIEHENGFVSYKIGNRECYIQDIYIKPEHRKSGLAAELADQVAEIAKTKDCEILTGTVSVGAKNDTASLKVLLAYGMKLDSINGNMIIMYKDLGEK